jgi:hypothetical protein
LDGRILLLREKSSEADSRKDNLEIILVIDKSQKLLEVSNLKDVRNRMKTYSECHTLNLRDEICWSNCVHGLKRLLNRDINDDLFTLSKVLRFTYALSRNAKNLLLTKCS